MTISQSAEYALRAVVWLAAHPERTLSTLAIAKGTRVPAGYLSKVLQGLARAGLVESCPGRVGGFTLTYPPADISVFDVVNAVDPLQRIRFCPLGIKAHGSKLCPLHRSLDQVAEATERVFRQTTIAQLLSGDDASPPLCDAGTRRVKLGPIRSGESVAGRRSRRGRRAAGSVQA